MAGVMAESPAERPRRTLNEATRSSITGQSAAMSPGSESFSVGDRVVVGNGQMRGTLRFLGGTTFAAGEWAGVELDEQNGKNDGSVKGERYFECPKEHGLFVRPNVLAKINPNSKRNSFINAAIDRPSNMGGGGGEHHEDDSGFRPGGRRTVRMSEVIEEVPSLHILMAKAQAAAAEPKAIHMDSDAESDGGREGANVRRSSLENLDSMDWCMSSPAPSPDIRPPGESPKARRSSGARRESGSRRDSGGRRSSRESKESREAPPSSQNIEDRRQAQRELAEAMEDHDLERLRRLLPLAERAGVPPLEIDSARNILNFQVQQQMVEEIEEVRHAVKTLTDAVQIAEARTATVEKAAGLRHTNSKPAPKRVPPGASREDGEAWMASVGHRLEERVWNGLEQRLEDAICAAVMRATQELVSVAREIGQLQAPTNGVSKEKRPSLRARPGEMEENDTLRLRPGECDSPPRKPMHVERSAPSRQGFAPSAAQAQTPCKPSDLARLCLRGAYQKSTLSEVSDDPLIEIERLRGKMQHSRRKAEATVSTASTRIQAVERGRQARRTIQTSRTQAQQLRYGDACKTIQAAVRRWQDCRRTCSIRDFATVAHAARRKHAGWAGIFDKQLTGGGVMASRGLSEAAFVAAIQEAHRGTSRKQACALWSGYTNGTGKPGVDIKGFCSIAEAIAIGSDAASEFADLCIEDYEALQDPPSPPSPKEAKLSGSSQLKIQKKMNNLRERMKSKVDLAQRLAARKLQGAARRWKARRHDGGADDFGSAADRFGAAVEATCSRLKVWNEIYNAALREAHGECNGHSGLQEASFRKAILEVHPTISAGQTYALWCGFRAGTNKDVMDLPTFCGIIEALYIGADAASEFADMSMEAFQILGAKGAEQAAQRIQATYKGQLTRKQLNAHPSEPRRPPDVSRSIDVQMPAATPAVARTPPKKPPPLSPERQNDVSARRIQRLFRRRCERRKVEEPASMRYSSTVALMRYRHPDWVSVFETHAKSVGQAWEIVVESALEAALLQIHPRLSQAQVHALWLGYLSCTELNGMGLADFCALVEALSRSDAEAAEFADLSAERFSLLASQKGIDIERSSAQSKTEAKEAAPRDIARFMSSFAYRRVAESATTSQSNKDVTQLLRGSLYRFASGTQR